MNDKALTTASHGGEVLLNESRPIYDGLMVVRSTLAPDLTPGELQLFALVAFRSGLDPFARQIYAVKRKGHMTIQTGIDGYRSIAARTGEYDGQDEPTFGPDCSCGKGPRHPESSTVAVYRKGMGRAVKATAYWHEYVPESNDFMWQRMPHVMLAKVSEALALRKAFPWDPTSGKGIGSDVYTDEEMAQADSSPRLTLQERLEARAEEPGTSLQYFADRVRDMDPDTIRRIRGELFPKAKGVRDLSDADRSVLLGRLIELENGQEVDGEAVEITEDSLAPVQEEEVGAPNPEEEEPRVLRASPPSEPMVACEAESPFTAGAVCLLARNHRGAHRSGESEAWPR